MSRWSHKPTESDRRSEDARSHIRASKALIDIGDQEIAETEQLMEDSKLAIADSRRLLEKVAPKGVGQRSGRDSK